MTARRSVATMRTDTHAEPVARARVDRRAAAAFVRLEHADSYSRLPILLDLAELLPYERWLAELGRQWTICDNVGLHRARLRRLLPARGPVMPMMTAAEAAAWSALPDVVEVFRGCGTCNLRGLSWSLSRQVASRFPRLMRYYADPALLVVGRVHKTRVLAIKLDREEVEVISAGVRRVRIELIGPAARAPKTEVLQGVEAAGA